MIELREVRAEDCKLLFLWVNDPKVRDSFFDSKRITWQEHKIWFSTKMNKETCRMFILEKDKNPLGEIRFDKENESWIVSYSIAEKYRGMGMGKKIIKLGLEKIEGKVKAWVKQENIASRRVFQNLGFKKLSTDNEVSLFVIG